MLESGQSMLIRLKVVEEMIQEMWEAKRKILSLRKQTVDRGFAAYSCRRARVVRMNDSNYWVGI